MAMTCQDDEGWLRHPDPDEPLEPLPDDCSFVAFDESHGREVWRCHHYAGDMISTKGIEEFGFKGPNLESFQLVFQFKCLYVAEQTYNFLILFTLLCFLQLHRGWMM